MTLPQMIPSAPYKRLVLGIAECAISKTLARLGEKELGIPIIDPTQAAASIAIGTLAMAGS